MWAPSPFLRFESSSPASRPGELRWRSSSLTPITTLIWRRSWTSTWRRYGVQAQLAAGLDDAILLPGKHFVQEDCPEEVADAVYQLAKSTR